MFPSCRIFHQFSELSKSSSITSADGRQDEGEGDDGCVSLSGSDRLLNWRVCVADT